MSPQQIIAHYRVTAKLGEGGMGTVYRATDTKLGRDVAIKVLPDIFAQDADRMARFTREARVLASLNHPNIAAIYGVEECALVMELVEGLTLAERIAQGPIPLDEALAIAQQIAEALEYAHEKNVVHRDLKPANIKVTPEGRVKVLDFGLAKALAEETPAADPASSPTVTMRATMAGVIMGTAGYMAPEQARGKVVDKRADIWAFGVVFYEMLTGKLLYAGETVSDTIAAVLTKEVDLTAVPPKVKRLLTRCLEKDPKKRLRDMGDYAGFLDDAIAEARPTPLGPLPWIVAGVTAAAALALAAWVLLHPQPLPTVTRFQIFAPPGSTLPLGTPAPSPDGRMLAYLVRGPDGVTRIAVRSLDSTETRILNSTDGALHPFWSPDGKSLGFAASSQLKRIDLAGGSPRALAETNAPWHGAWNQFGRILFAANGILSMSAEGGAVEKAVKWDTAKGEYGGGFPFFLPDGKRFLMLMGRTGGARDIHLATLGSADHKVVVPDILSAPILAPAPNGQSYLLYLQEGSLMAREFDPQAGTVRGNQFLLIETVGSVASPALRPAVGVSPAGILAYQTGRSMSDTPLDWVDRSGKLAKESGPVGENPSISPDGGSVAVVRRSMINSDIWLVELTRGASTRFTFSGKGQIYTAPVWSPDGKRLAYRLMGTGIFVKDASGAGAEEKVLDGSGTPASWSPDGRQILYWTDSRLFLLPLSGDRTPIPVGPSGTVPPNMAQISPDGKFFAFTSVESGRREVYIEPMPPGPGKWQISTGGGRQPRWRKDGKELFFLALDGKMMAADLRIAGQGIAAGSPHPLFQTSIQDMAGAPYDVSADGQQFLLGHGSSGNADAPITVVLNWWTELRGK